MSDETKKTLIEIYFDEDSINYEFNINEEEIILANNLLICGTLEKIKKNLLDVQDLIEAEDNSKESEVGEAQDESE